MLELERRGAALVVASLYPPKTPLRHGYLSRLRAPVHYAPGKEVLEAMARKARKEGRWPAELVARHERQYGPDYKAALRARNALFFDDLFRRENVAHFHVHFTNRAAHTALFVQALSGLSFSVTAHGQDFMRDLGNDELLREICAAAEFVAAETEFSRALLARRCPESAQKIVHIPNGLDRAKLPRPVAREEREESALRLVSVGRLVEFKGFDVLIRACAELKRSGLAFSCEIVGDGPLREELQALVAAHDLAGHVRLTGERTQEYVLETLGACDIFVLAATVDSHGASDVFPTVIAEAMALGRPVVSTTVAGIPELVVSEETGLLVEPGQVAALSAALARLAHDPAERARLGEAGRIRLETNFLIETTIEPLWERLVAAGKNAPSPRPAS